MNRVESAGLAWYRFDGWPQLHHGVFTRRGGCSPPPWASLNTGGNIGDEPLHVRRNHERIFGALAVNEKRACTVWQVHSADIVLAHGPVRNRRWLAKADAMLTAEPDTPLVMRFADCVPLLFFDPGRQVIGMAHAGWRGTVQDIAGRMVGLMADAWGCQPEDIEAGIGPSIGPDCYQVGEEVVEAVEACCGTLDGLVKRDPVDGSAWLDLWACNRLLLERAGVRHIELAALCTACHLDDFYSHRAEGGRTGRFCAVMTL
ncbi:MAG: peptidoglycan editing factor PgeF [Anaerolineaceae bacterium]|nr:peptidoglycan editing factor PgeF [Anaerolineaceae bacterium]